MSAAWSNGRGSKPNRAILVCPWEKHLTAISLAWLSWQAVLSFSDISLKLKHILFQTDSNIRSG